MAEKVVVITGASSGIGAALAELLASRGLSVALVARRVDRLREVSDRCGSHAAVLPGDVTRRNDVVQVAKDAIERFGCVDVWVNNAGRGITRMPTALTDEDIDEMILVNVKSVLYGTQAILPHFKERGSGHVINVSSMLGRLPFAISRSAYTGAKHFVNALTAMLREEVQHTHPGIQISLVSPGVVSTDFGLSAKHGGPDSRQLPDAQSPESVAEVIAKVIETRQADVYTRTGSRDRVGAYYASVGVDA